MLGGEKKTNKECAIGNKLGTNVLNLLYTDVFTYSFVFIIQPYDFTHTEAVAQSCSIKKGFLEILQNSQESTRTILFFNKVAGLRPKNTFSYRTPPVAASVHNLSSMFSLGIHLQNTVTYRVMKSLNRSSHPEMFLQKAVVKICSKLTERHLLRTLLGGCL